MNIIFMFIVLIAYATTAYHQYFWVPATPDANSPMQQLGLSMIQSAGDSVSLAIGLIGVMTLFLGLMKVAEAGGLLTIIAKLLRPILTRLFPDIPPDHPAMGAMVLNISANALGLGNAATPFGIRAMHELNTLNAEKGVATNAMVLFLAINTSSVTLLPTGIIALRAAAGSHDPAGIVPTTLFATACSTVAAICLAKLFQRFSQNPDTVTSTPSETNNPVEADDNLPSVEQGQYPMWASMLAIAAVIGFIPLTIFYGNVISPWIIPSLMLGLLGFGALNKVAVYEVFVEGAKEGFQVAIKIVPYLVAILVAVAMFRQSGALDVLIGAIGPVTSKIGLPAEALPMALLRPLSGSGAYGIVASVLNDPALGPDSYVGYLVSTFQGTTETTFYVLAVYFGAIQIKKTRHALFTALSADIVGIASAVFIVSSLYG